MNILTSTLPTKIKVHDNIYDINYDYRTIIRILTAFEDTELLYEEKLYILIKNLYKSEVKIEDYEEACLKGIMFIDGGEEHKKEEGSPRIYSFKKDANYIFTGINSTHHVDIEKDCNLHWWKFLAFFMDMSTKCMFSELVYYRKRKLEGKLTKEEKKQYKVLKDLLELDNTHVQSEARKQFFEEFHKNEK